LAQQPPTPADAEKKFASISGIVISTAGTPLPEAAVTLLRVPEGVADQQSSPAVVTLVPDPPQPGLPWLYQVTDAGISGQFRFLTVPPGKYRIYAWERQDADAHFDPEFVRPHEGRGVMVEVRGGGITEAALRRFADL
jgi:hypothetical protein